MFFGLNLSGVKAVFSYTLLLFFLCPIFGHASSPEKEVVDKTKSFSTPWINVSADYWDFSGVKTGLELRTTSIKPKKGVERTSVHDVFERWIFPLEQTGTRGRSYVDITDQCKGLIDERFVLSQNKWQKLEERLAYFKGIDSLIKEVVAKLLRDQKVTFSNDEKNFF